MKRADVVSIRSLFSGSSRFRCGPARPGFHWGPQQVAQLLVELRVPAVYRVHAQPDPTRMFAMTTHGSQPVHSTCFLPGDWLVFGAETRGLPPELRESFPPAQRLRLPMVPGQRSLNLSNAVAVTVFEAWRQNSFAMPDGQVMVEPEGTIISGFAQLN